MLTRADRIALARMARLYGAPLYATAQEAHDAMLEAIRPCLHRSVIEGRPPSPKAFVDMCKALWFNVYIHTVDTRPVRRH